MANQNRKKIEVIQGNGNLEISPVEQHLEVEKPHSTPPKDKIIIPQERHTKK